MLKNFVQRCRHFGENKEIHIKPGSRKILAVHWNVNYLTKTMINGNFHICNLIVEYANFCESCISQTTQHPICKKYFSYLGTVSLGDISTKNQEGQKNDVAMSE